MLSGEKAPAARSRSRADDKDVDVVVEDSDKGAVLTLGGEVKSDEEALPEGLPLLRVSIRNGDAGVLDPTGVLDACDEPRDSSCKLTSAPPWWRKRDVDEGDSIADPLRPCGVDMTWPWPPPPTPLWEGIRTCGGVCDCECEWEYPWCCTGWPGPYDTGVLNPESPCDTDEGCSIEMLL